MNKNKTALLIGTVLLISGCSTTKTNKDKAIQSGGNALQPQYEILGNGGSDGTQPKLKPAQVRVRFVDDQSKDGIFTPAHLEYEIATPAHWEGGK